MSSLALAVAASQSNLDSIKALVLDSVSSPLTRAMYGKALDDFLTWYASEPRTGFSKATVQAHRAYLEAKGYSASTINQRLSAIRKLAMEAADNGLIPPELATGITRVRGAKLKGIRSGNWLTKAQAEALINAPDTGTGKGKRDKAILAMLIGCGLRRSEVAALRTTDVQQRDGRWVIVDLVGKHGRVRTIPVPAWVKAMLDQWTLTAGINDGFVFRSINRGGRLSGTSVACRLRCVHPNLCQWNVSDMFVAESFADLRNLAYKNPTFICRNSVYGKEDGLGLDFGTGNWTVYDVCSPKSLELVLGSRR
ncbi:MAG TPA: tyrosine-type recombinase/integrase [Bryobacteraceae bacterium]|nr:tyrosine-type recombinase/integrase [Bryobacteraceae bacterium]